ncbi:MAG: HEAT repeat domain-containing protein [Deltaproteobacteria bacterium]|nr:HEAT repeat domain-containing protein [Deltaproteobacteria bacterium]
MAVQDIQGKAIDALVIMNTAIINLRLYPPTNAMIVNTVDRMYETFVNAFEEIDSVIYAEAEKNLLVCGEPLSQKYQERPQVAIFLMLMIKWGIKSLEFLKGLEKSELMPLLELLGKKPEDFKEKGLAEVISSGLMPHIRINQKVYIEKDREHQIIAGADIKDEDVIRFITAEDPDAVKDLQQLKEKAKDPAWISKIIQSGMQSLSDKEGHVQNIKLSENMLHMLRTLDSVSNPEDKEKIAKLVAEYISGMDAQLVAMTLTKNVEGILGNHVFGQVIKDMDDRKFEAVVEKVSEMLNAAAGDETIDEKNKASLEQAYRQMMSSDKGVEYQKKKQEEENRKLEEKEKRIRIIRNERDNILRELDKDIPDESVIKSSAGMVEMAFSEGEHDAVETVIGRLIDRLAVGDTVARSRISEALAQSLECLPLEKRSDSIIGYLDKVTAWVKAENDPSLALRAVCVLLQDIARHRIHAHLFAESLPVLETFRYVISRQDEVGAEIRGMATEILSGIAIEEMLKILIEEIRTNREGKRNEAGRNLVMMREYSVGRLLYLLKETEDSNEIIMILNLIAEMGKDVAPHIVERIKDDAPWDYLRNLARLLGRVGSPGDAKTLAPLLIYDDIRVQREALKTVNMIGGALRGEILVAALPKCDEQLKAGIVTTLGSLKYHDAVKPLIDLFHAKAATLSADAKADLQEKICLALGNIGDKEALPFLNEVSRQSSFLSIKPYHPKVKAAAGKAVGMIAGT